MEMKNKVTGEKVLVEQYIPGGFIQDELLIDIVFDNMLSCVGDVIHFRNGLLLEGMEYLVVYPGEDLRKVSSLKELEEKYEEVVD